MVDAANEERFEESK